ncbi:hypothetical protein HDF12_003928 [Edaphobacter lichenicola]|uniref:Uncharacterized protein n=1 Tax=Tunturiibacter lichenicola TaxID=2051959 RepID=A0A7Y9NQ82_9BACT|nr:hypothetical protein [Edaphobacter lichenicola]
MPHPQGSSASRECSLFATSEVMGTTSTRKRKGRFLFRDLAPCFPIFEDPVRDPDHN